MQQLRLHPGLPDGRWATVRELCGHDEKLITGPAAGSAAVATTDLLDRLLVETPGSSVGPGRAWDLALCDRDRLLAGLYTTYFGDRIEGTSICSECGEGRDVAFSLAALIESLEPAAGNGVVGPDDQCRFTLSDGRRFRLPTAKDQRRVAGLEPQEARQRLLDRCLVDGSPDDIGGIEEAMEVVGPVLSLDLPRQCPECEEQQTVHFDIANYLLTALATEKKLLLREVHALAFAYHWRLDEILGLPRSERRTFVRLIESDLAGAREALA